MDLMNAIADSDLEEVKKLMSNPDTVVKENMLDVAFYHMTKKPFVKPDSLFIFSLMVKDERVDKNYQDIEGNTVLHKACMIDDEWMWPFNAIVRKRKNVDPNITNYDNLLPLDLAIRNPVKVRKLLRCGSQLTKSIVDKAKCHPLVLDEILKKYPQALYME